MFVSRRRRHWSLNAALFIIVSLGLLGVLELAGAATPAVAATPSTVQTHHIGAVYVTLVKRMPMAGLPVMGDPTNMYLIVFVRVVNRGHVPLVPFGDREFAMTGAAGDFLERQPTCGDEAAQSPLRRATLPTLCAANTGTLAPGQSLYGSITFRAPRHHHKATLVWTLDDSTNISARWNVTY